MAIEETIEKKKVASPADPAKSQRHELSDLMHLKAYFPCSLIKVPM